MLAQFTNQIAWTDQKQEINAEAINHLRPLELNGYRKSSAVGEHRT
jgi:hypothetical protein